MTAPEDNTPKPRRRWLRFSLRSILIVMGGAAGLCALMFAPHPFSGVIPAAVIAAGDLAIYLLCWTVVGASIGYDIVPQRKGWIMGVCVSAVIGMVMACVWSCASMDFSMPFAK